MLSARVYLEDWDVDKRLQPFGVTRAELLYVVKAVVGARADAVDDDPVTAAGQFAYIYGTRHLRQLLQPKKWLRHREQNVESVRHPERDLKVVYQSVDLAASEFRSPQAISAKGSGTDRIIDLAQGSLFTRAELDRLNPATVAPINTGIWFFCVSVNGDDVRAELSLPSSLEGGNFKGFIERIFIVRGGEWPSVKIAPTVPGDVVEFEPTVTRRE